MLVTAAYTVQTLAFLALPLLFIELPVVIIFVAVTLAKQRSRASRGDLPPSSGQADRAIAAERRAGPDPASPGARASQASADLRVDRSPRHRPGRSGQGVPIPRGARPAPGAA